MVRDRARLEIGLGSMARIFVRQEVYNSYLGSGSALLRKYCINLCINLPEE